MIRYTLPPWIASNPLTRKIKTTGIETFIMVLCWDINIIHLSISTICMEIFNHIQTHVQTHTQTHILINAVLWI